MAVHCSDAQIRVGVELTVFMTSQLRHDYAGAYTLDEPTFVAVQELTSVFDPSGQRTRNLLGAVAAVRAAIAHGQKFQLPPGTYEQARAQIGLRAGLEDAPAWPVPWTEVAYRLGNGLWNRALETMGVDAPTTRCRTSPSARPADAPAQDAADEVQRLHDPGIGLISAVPHAEEVPESLWDRLRDLLAEDLATLPWKSQLVLKYVGSGTGNTPSAWTNSGPQGFTCALSSTVTVPVTHWPLDLAYFEEGHWEQPSSWDRPWTAGPLDAVTAAERMLDGLRFGRLCTNPYNYRWGTTAITTPSVAAPLEDESREHGEVIPLRSV